jgi:holo-[acyl-carrier protein] synthase
VIYGIGTDLVDIGRVAAAVERFGERFAERVLGPQEQARYRARRARSPRRGLAFLATRFAAKEAVSKAIGLGMRSPMSWRAVEIVNAPSGQPLAVAHGALAEFLQARRLRLTVSVTDEQAMAMAFVVAEVMPGDPAGRA